MLPLILTATLDEAAHRYFDELRRRHFPPDRNVLAAHLTLFHALAGECIAEVEEDISNTVQGIPVQPGNAAGLRSLGSGVAFVIECPGLVELRRDFAERWWPYLTPQDRQGWRPHVTVQNKATPEAARELLRGLQASFTPFAFGIEGLELWFYENGPWRLARTFRFQAA